MSQQRAKRSEAIGFLTVIDYPQHGLFGGYLVLNTAGRPLEFHCTAPIKPSRAQKILYGPTLEPYLYGEQIGQTLIGQAEVEPLLVCTDVVPALEAASYVSMPVLLVDGASDGAAANASDGAAAETDRVTEGGVRPSRWGSRDRDAEAGNVQHCDADLSAGQAGSAGLRAPSVAHGEKALRLDAAHRGMAGLHWFELGGNRLGLLAEMVPQWETIQQQVHTVATGLDLAEPFQRIRQAIDEARRGSRG